MRGRRHLILVVLVIVAITSAGSVSSASSKDGTTRRAQITIVDPEDVAPCPPEYLQDCPIDIREVSARRFTTSAGRRMLALSVEAYELYGGLIFHTNIKFRLDVRSGPRADERVFIVLDELNARIGWACSSRWFFGVEGRRYRLRERGDRLTCIVPMRELRPVDKPIRMNAQSRFKRAVVDRVPDVGWQR